LLGLRIGIGITVVGWGAFGGLATQRIVGTDGYHLSVGTGSYHE
jgi:hypothetical protein